MSFYFSKFVYGNDNKISHHKNELRIPSNYSNHYNSLNNSRFLYNRNESFQRVEPQNLFNRYASERTPTVWGSITNPFSYNIRSSNQNSLRNVSINRLEKQGNGSTETSNLFNRNLAKIHVRDQTNDKPLDWMKSEIEMGQVQVSSYSEKFKEISRKLDNTFANIKSEIDMQVEDRIEEEMELVDEENGLVTMDIDDETPQDEVMVVDKRKTSLTENELNEIESLLNERDSDRIVIDKYNVELMHKKICCLRPSTWLNDEVINFYMNLLQDRDAQLTSTTPTRVRSYYFNTFFIAKLLFSCEGYNYKEVRRWSKKFDALQMDKIFVPINLHNSHWTLAVIFMQKHEIHYYDSLGGGGNQYLKGLLRWCVDEAMDKKKEVLNVQDWKLIDHYSEIPGQSNSYDCGVFVIMYADYLSDDLPLHQCLQKDMPYFRLMIAASIKRGYINY